MISIQEETLRKNSELFEKFVPNEGPALTVGGEAVRALNRLVYRFYNDGDKVGRGYGRESCGEAARFLTSCKGLPPFVKVYVKALRGASEDEAYGLLLEQLRDRLTDFLYENQNGDIFNIPNITEEKK